VFGGYYDEEFEEFTKPLFDRIMKDEFVLLFSAVTQDELDNAPTRVQELVRHIKVEFTEFIDLSAEVIRTCKSILRRKGCGTDKLC
jgi:hypothetical protein